MNILYVHGFGSQYDPTQDKIQMLETIGTVSGITIDYCKGFDVVLQLITDAVQSQKIDLIIGTSMGGYMAAHVGSRVGIPFVSLNPAIAPSTTLQRWIGNFTDYAGNDRCLTETGVASYPNFPETGCGLVIVESSDEVISASLTRQTLDQVFHVETFAGGSHRFTHIERALPLIQAHYQNAQNNYGLE
jgi:predicted esterase YcpF (UPF0227 family)